MADGQHVMGLQVLQVEAPERDRGLDGRRDLVERRVWHAVQPGERLAACRTEVDELTDDPWRSTPTMNRMNICSSCRSRVS